MSGRVIGMLAGPLLLLLAGCAAGPTRSAATPPQGAAAARDLSGIWLQDQGVLFSDPTKGVASGRHPGYDESINPAPLTPEFQARYDAIKAERKAGRAVADPGANCMPPGMPRLMVNPYPFEVLHTPGRITLIFTTDNHVRRIFTDGRSHPEELMPTMNGHSVGHWEGDTLVVETVGLRADKYLQNTGLPHSDQLVVHERIRLLNPDKLEDAITMVDPKAFTRPYQSVRTYTRLRGEEIEEYVCHDNNRAAGAQSQTVK